MRATPPSLESPSSVGFPISLLAGDLNRRAAVVFRLDLGDQCAHVLWLRNSSLHLSSASLIPNCTSTTLPTPSLHALSHPSIVARPPSCAPFLSRLISSVRCFVSTSSFSNPLSTSSNWLLPTNHAFLPNCSNNSNACSRDPK